MNKDQFLPFERNRYYAGKMLASSDFQAEQQYMDNKRRFINSAMFGQGVVCGLGVSVLDDLSVLVEEGVALDAMGREIVLESSAVKKLSALEGFENLEGDRVQLRIRYREDKVHPVYAVGGGEGGEEYEFNRIREGYELFVTDCKDDEPEKVPDYMEQAVLLKQEDYCVTVRMPAAVSRGCYVRLRLTAKKLSGRKASLSFEGILQLPSFVTEEGKRELAIGMREVVLNQGQSMSRDYWILADRDGQDTSGIILKADAGQAFVNDYDTAFRPDASLRVSLREEEPRRLVLEQTGGKIAGPQQEKAMEGVFLAELTLFRAQGAYVITAVEENKEYIAAPSKERQRQEYLACFVPPADWNRRKQEAEEAGEAKRQEIRYEMPLMTSGSIEIPLDVNMKKGEVCYSEEIMHGLGKGDVYVQAGTVCLEEEDRMGGGAKCTVYGDNELFQEQEHTWVRTAVKVYNEKGSFQVAARLEGEQRSIVLLIHWVAVRFTSSQENRLAEDYSNMSITARTPTIRMEAGTSRHIEILYHHMKPCRLVYELTERGSGEVTQDGIYTAPAAEGVYEIHVYCADIPQIATYAYAIVTKKQGIL